jgi:hypothetical protein
VNKREFLHPLAFCLCVLILLSACSQQVSYMRFGRFVLATHLTVDTLKWEGSNTRLNFMELCRDDGTMCFRGDDDLSYDYSRRYKRLLVNTKTSLKLFDSENGTEILCDFKSLHGRLGTGVSATWSVTAMSLRSSRDQDGLNYITIRTDTYDMHSGCTLIGSNEAPFEKISYGSQDPDSGELAWLACKANGCSLTWLKSDLLTVIQKKEIGCSYGQGLELKWLNGVPEPRNSSNEYTPPCLDSEGKLKYPRAQPRKLELNDDAPDERF